MWGQEAPEQLIPMFSQPCPQHTLTEGLSVSGYDLVTHTSPSLPCGLASSIPKSLGPRPAPAQQHFRKREGPRRLAKRAGEGAPASQKCPQVPQSLGQKNQASQGPHNIQRTRRRTPRHLPSTSHSHTPQMHLHIVRFRPCHWSELLLTLSTLYP